MPILEGRYVKNQHNQSDHRGLLGNGILTVGLFTFHIISHDTFISAMWACSRGHRCLSNISSLNADNFRKDGSGYHSNIFLKTYNYCRYKPPCPRTGESPPLGRCTSCNTIKISHSHVSASHLLP